MSWVQFANIWKIIDSKGLIRGNTKDPYLKLQLVEISIESVKKDHSHSLRQNLSWIIQVCDELEHQRAGNLWDAIRRFLRGKTTARAFASRSKAEAKPQRRTSFCQLITKTVPNHKISRSPIIQCRKKNGQSFSSWKTTSRKMTGTIEFWRRKGHLWNYFLYCHHLSDDKWKKNMTGGARK